MLGYKIHTLAIFTQMQIHSLPNFALKYQTTEV